MMTPSIRHTFAQDSTELAYWALGSGPPLLVIPSFPTHHLELEWSWQKRRRNYEKLASRLTVMRFDGRGTGMSQRVVTDLSPEVWIKDVDAIAAALDLNQFAILAEDEATVLALAYAAERPRKVSHLILWQPPADASDVYKEWPAELLAPIADKDWHLYSLLWNTARRGWANGETARQLADIARAATTPNRLRSLICLLAMRDVAADACAVEAPTLVVVAEGVNESTLSRLETLADSMKHARVRDLEIGAGNAFLDDAGELADEVLHFILDDHRGWPSSRDSGAGHREFTRAELTPREQEILAFLASPLTTREIAARLVISLPTLQRHIANAYRKLAVHTRIEASFASLPQTKPVPHELRRSRVENPTE